MAASLHLQPFMHNQQGSAIKLKGRKQRTKIIKHERGLRSKSKKDKLLCFVFESTSRKKVT